MDQKLERYSRLYKLVARNLTVLFIAVLILIYFFLGLKIFNINYFFYIVVAVDAFALLFTEKKWVKHYVKYLFLAFLVLVTVSSISYLEDVFLLKTIVSFLNKYLVHLTVLTIASGVLTFYFNRDVIESVEQEKEDEENAEKKREKEFDKKFLRLNFFNFNYGIKKAIEEKEYAVAIGRMLFAPVVFLLRLPYSFTKWMYREEWRYSIILLLIMVYVGVLIFHNLGAHSIFHDEQWHRSVIESLSHGEGFHLWNFVTETPGEFYGRGYFVNYFGYINSELFGKNELSFRLFPAFIGLILVPTTYLVFRKFTTKSIALVASIGFNLNIISLFLARFLRPYTMSVFAFLICFYLLFQISQQLKKEKICLKHYIYGILFFIFMIISFQASQITKIILPLTALYGTYVIFIHRNKLLRMLNNKSIIYFILSVLMLIVIAHTLKFMDLTIILNQAIDSLSIEKIGNPTNKYYNYLFEYFIKLPTLAYLSFFIGIIILLFKTAFQKLEKDFQLFIFAIVPLIFMIYFFDRYEDFRYIYYLIPFIYCVIGIGFYYVLNLFSGEKSKYINLIFVIIFVLLLINIPAPIESISGFTIKAPSIWGEDDGKDILHRRAVPPDYEKVYEYLNANQQSTNIVILRDGKYNLKPKNGTTYYELDAWSGSINFTNLRTNETANGLKLLKRTENKTKIFFEAGYVHYINEEILDYLLNNCENKAKELGVKKYNYNSFYKNRFYFPNLWVCEKV